MDLSYLPDILALTVFFVCFHPLVRKIGPQVNLWFIGWSFVLLHHVAMLFSPHPGLVHAITRLVGIWSFDLAALSFLLVSANVPRRRIGHGLALEFAVACLFPSTLFAFQIRQPLLYALACLLFVAPAVHMALRRRSRSRAMIVISIVFAAFGLFVAPFRSPDPALLSYGSLSLLMLSAAALYLSAAESISRGVIAATAGMALCGLTFPVILALLRFDPGVHFNSHLVDAPVYLIAAGIILTLLEQHMQRTERMAMHDPLTDLPNRRLFEERLIATMEEARLNRTTVACLVIDVDNFKTINDTLGHGAGDQLLRALAVRLSWHMSPRDILARTGGDEFTALLAGVSDEHHLRFIASAMMSAGSVPMSIEGQSVDVRISIGNSPLPRRRRRHR